jgi:hypothetical protein
MMRRMRLILLNGSAASQVGCWFYFDSLDVQLTATVMRYMLR